jgi:porphobilinogen deaminase
VQVFASTQTVTKTVKIGTRGSPLALAQAYLTRDLLKVNAQHAMRLCNMSGRTTPQQ